MQKFNKSISAFFLPLIDDKLRQNIVKVAVEPRATGEWFCVVNFDNVMTNLPSIRGQTHKKLMSICFLQ